MNTSRFLNTFVIAVSLLITSLTSVAAEEDLCAPFKDGKVDKTVLETMLNAAEKGHLYRIVAKTSRVGFCVNSKLKRIEGDFHDFQGGITLSEEGSGEAQALVVIHTDSLDTEAEVIKNLLKSESFFDVSKYPEILFVSTGFKWTSSTTGILKGNLTLRGITRPVTFHLTLSDLEDGGTNAGKKILVKATTTINRSSFGMDTMSNLVSDDVQLCLSVEANKYGT